MCFLAIRAQRYCFLCYAKEVRVCFLLNRLYFLTYVKEKRENLYTKTRKRVYEKILVSA